MKPKIVAVIPARKNSKRLPRKNILNFHGKPLIYYTIRFAQLQNQITKVVVSTDDEEVMTIADEMGVEYIVRPEHLSSDVATTASAIQHALEMLNQKSESFDYVVTLQVTNPLRQQELFSSALQMISTNDDWDSLISVSKNHLKIGHIRNNYFVPMNYKPGQRSQDLEPEYYENGQLYISKADLMLDKGELFGDRMLVSIMPQTIPYVDIDTELDFHWGEYLFTKNQQLFSYLL